MNLREDLNALTPRLRRYARALVSGHPGGCERADDLVHATLMRTLGSRHIGTQSDLVIRVYATLTQIHRDVADAATLASAGSRPAGLAVRQSKLTASLMSLPLGEREALLLVALETFDHVEAARILRVSRTELLARLTRARLAMEDQFQARPHSLHQPGHPPHGLPQHGLPLNGVSHHGHLPPRVVGQDHVRQEALRPEGVRQIAVNQTIASPRLAAEAMIHQGARTIQRRHSHLKLVKS